MFSSQKKTPLVNAPPSDTKASIILGVAFLFLGIGGFLYWAATAPLDEGIPSMGVLSAESKRKTISHLDGGIVKDIYVREAQLVETGTPLLTLDDTIIKANYEGALQTYDSLLATESRLIAERAGATQISFPEELISEKKSAVAKQHMKTQKSLFNTRRANLASQLAVLNETAAINEAQAKGYEEQLHLIEKQLSGLRELTKQGYAPRNQLLELERQRAELEANIERARHTASESRLRGLQYKDAYQQEVETNLADTQRDLANARDKVTVFKEGMERCTVFSPVKGYVTSLAIHTIGGVITPGMKIMDIVPASEKLIFEVHIASQLIDKLKIGLLADINLHNFADDPRLVIEGKLISVSADLLTDPNPNLPPYFAAYIEVTPNGLERLKPHELQAGMQADVVIKTGERTMLAYLMKPFLRRFHSALKET